MTAERIADVLGHEYDHYDPDFALDPHDTYTELRSKCPVGRSDAYGGFYVISKYEDIDFVLHHPEMFSSYPADTPPPPTHTRPLPPFESDPPDHRHYRRIVDPLFGPKRMNLLEPALRDAAAQLASRMVELGTFDFIKEFARPYPSSAFLAMLGVDADRALRDQLCAWVERILHASHGDGDSDAEERTEVRVEAARALRRFLSDVLDESREDPSTVFHALFAATFAGERDLSREEVLDFSYLLVLAGVDTVTTALGFSFLHLAKRPDLVQRLIDDRSMIPAAVEELLRFESAVHPSRTVTTECAVGGVALTAGDRIVIPYASADRDEEVFERPTEIDIDRSPNRHFAFGIGAHRCLGSHLARLEMRIAFEELITRMPRFSLVDEEKIVAYGGQTRSLASLLLRTE